MAVRVEIGSSARRVAALLVTVLLALLVVYGAYAYAEGTPPFGQRDDEWSAVFLTNGQAYFGHFYSGPGEYARLREVYYVLATQLQTGQSAPQTQLTVQARGREIHGPAQDMLISKEQILFVERLRPDSQVVATIRQIKSGVAPQPQPQAPAATNPPATTAPPTTPAASPSPTRSP